MLKLSAAAVLISISIVSPARSDTEDGRFRIVNGELISGGKSAMLLDSQTGRTWILVVPREGSISWVAVQFQPIPNGGILTPHTENDPPASREPAKR